jgi:hypothetical protein
MSTRPPEFLKLKDNHPALLKLNQLIEFMDKIGLSIVARRNNLVICDAEKPDRYYEIVDTENGSDIDSFPPTFEFVVRFRNPDRDKFDEEEFNNRKAAELEEKKKKEAEEVERRRQETENSERALLGFLKTKYEK